jgi:ABC-type multidrug transport system fused ATPase/permease subunit
MPAAIRVVEILNAGQSAEADKDIAEPVKIWPAVENVHLRNVSYRYSERPTNAVSNFTLNIPAYSSVALVGESGAGKSTVLRLLSRFIKPNAGAIEIDGVDIATASEKSLRQTLSIVHQEPFLFEGTIIENIRFGHLDANDEEIAQATRLAHAAEFIEALPDGYETLVGERGTWLSGGQRQRIAVARALVANSPILILDEATANLDPETESLIFDAIDQYRRRKTVIVATHRLARVRDFDQIVVLSEGCVVEQGTHGELMGIGGYYKRMVLAEQDNAAGQERTEQWSH